MASVRPSAPVTDGKVNGQMIRSPGRVSYSYVSIQNLLAQAYVDVEWTADTEAASQRTDVPPLFASL